MSDVGAGDESLNAALFAALAGASNAFISCLDSERRVVFLNRTLSRDLSNILGRRTEEFIAPAHRDSMIETVNAALQTNTPQVLDYDAVLSGGDKRLLRTRLVPFVGPRGKTYVLQITEDLTEHQRLVAELQESVRLRALIVENLPDSVMLLDREHRYVWVNRPVAGYTVEQMLGQPYHRFVPPQQYQATKPAIDAAFENDDEASLETLIDDGATTRYLLTRVVPTHSAEMDNVLLLVSDMTEQRVMETALRAAEERFHRVQRLESVGQLAGGVAHDFNNLLQVIDGNLHFARENLRLGESADDELAQALRATERAAELTAHLLAVGRRQRVSPQRADIDELVSANLRMLRRVIPENIQLEYNSPKGECWVEVDQQQFDQVMINLCVNARDAMPSGGRLTIDVTLEPPQTVALRISDTGPGIPEENLLRIFEPFFTTKGAGSGLGLSVVEGIIAAHGGTIVAESSPGAGASFIVRLPRSESGTVVDAGHRAPQVGGQECVLIAEDEGMVRDQLVRALTRAGYEVLATDNGRRAVEMFREHSEHVDLVLLDVIMPEMDGWQAYRKIEEIRPGTRVLFSTGYASTLLPKDVASKGALVLNKPYNPRVLLQRVREVLDTGPSSSRVSHGPI